MQVISNRIDDVIKRLDNDLTYCIDFLHFYSPHHLQCKWCGHARIFVTSKNCIFTIFEIMSQQ